MSDQSKFIAGVLLGAAAGAAVAYLLSTEQGRELVKELKDKVSSLGEELSETAKQVEAEISDALNKGKQWADDAQSKAESFTS